MNASNNVGGVFWDLLFVICFIIIILPDPPYLFQENNAISKAVVLFLAMIKREEKHNKLIPNGDDHHSPHAFTSKLKVEEQRQSRLGKAKATKCLV